jgi:tetratricopeptide (TPR) repeat protein
LGLRDRDEAIRLKPDLAEAWLARGSAYYLLERFEDSIRDLERCLQLAPKNEEAARVLAKAHESLSRQQAERAAPVVSTPAKPEEVPAAPAEPERVAEATPPPAPAAEPTPEPPTTPPAPTAAEPVAAAPVAAPPATAPTGAAEAEMHNQRGREFLRQGKYQEAIGELDKAIQLNPRFAQAYNARGFARYLVKDYQNALADLDRAIGLDPRYINAYQNRSVVRKATGDTKGSMADLAKVQALGVPAAK